MKQIYDFAQCSPPALDERSLLKQLAQRRLRVQTALLALAGLLLQTAVMLFGYAALDWYPVASAICFGYGIISITGFGVCAVVYTQKGGETA